MIIFMTCKIFNFNRWLFEWTEKWWIKQRFCRVYKIKIIIIIRIIKTKRIIIVDKNYNIKIIENKMIEENFEKLK